jgi:predicted Rossmann-fold nucleotide-binding protein
MPHHDETLSLMLETAPLAGVAVGASPFTYVAQDSGRLVVQGGTVSLIELGRKGTFVTTGITTGVIPVSRGDSVRVTYTVLPTLTFFKQ